jgi:hypothetical protein
VLNPHLAVEVEGRHILLGDHTAVVKDARRMPGVVTLHQHSETQSKPTYFRGHYWGVLGLLTGSLQEAFCTPLEARLHQGLVHVDPELPSYADRDTQSTRLLHMALVQCPDEIICYNSTPTTPIPRRVLWLSDMSLP